MPSRRASTNARSTLREPPLVDSPTAMSAARPGRGQRGGEDTFERHVVGQRGQEEGFLGAASLDARRNARVVGSRLAWL